MGRLKHYIPKYEELAKQLDMPLNIYSEITEKKMLAVGNRRYDLLQNHAHHETHFVQSHGENIYLINCRPNQTNISTIIFHFKEKLNSSETIDVRELTKENNNYGPPLTFQIKRNESDILVESQQMTNESKPVLTINLKNGTHNFKKVRFILKRFPNVIKYKIEEESFIFEPMPLEIDISEKLWLILFPEDIEYKSELVLNKSIHSYTLARKNNDLIITNAHGCCCYERKSDR